MVDWAAGRISLAQEREYGRRFSTFTNSKEAEDARLPYLRHLLARLAPKDLNPALLPDIHLWDSSVPNAFAMAGGHMGFTQGLLEAAGSENELAFVTAHELGHYLNRDPLRHAGRALMQFSLLMLLSAGSAEQAGGALFGGGQQALAMRYSRVAEEKADDFAAAAVAAHYGHLGGALDFFKRQAKEEAGEEEGEGPDWFSSHPATPARIKRIEDGAKARGISLEGKLK
jgi:predicted Zn-dependent protease